MKTLSIRLLVVVSMVVSVLGLTSTSSAEAGSCGVTSSEPFRVRSYLSAESFAVREAPLNPVSGSQDFFLMPRIYEPLVQVRPDRLVPGLAEDWSSVPTADGGQVISFGLRDGVLWHDGDAFTAHDVAFSIMFARDSSPIDRGLEPVSAVEVVDDLTVRVWASDPSFLFLRRLAGTLMLPEHVWSQVADVATFQNPNPVGTGPFTYVGAGEFRTVRNPDTGEAVDVPIERYLKRFEDYWGGCSGLREVHLVVDDPDLPPMGPVEAIGDDHVDVWIDLGTDRATAVQAAAASGVGLHLQSAMGFRYLAFNFRRAPTNDPAFRRAIAHLIDREGSIAAADAIASQTPLRNLVLDQYGEWQNPDAVQPGYDPVAAKGLLEDAGYFGPSGQFVGEPIELLAPDASYDPVRAGFATRLAVEAQAIGVPLVVNLTDFSTIVDRAVGPAADFDMFILGWGLGASLDWMHSFFVSGQDSTQGGLNTPGISSAELDAHLDALVTANDRATAIEAAREAQAILAGQLPYAVLYTSLYPTFYDDTFTGYRTVDGDGWLFNNATLLGLESSLPPGLQRGLPPGLQGREPPPPFRGGTP